MPPFFRAVFRHVSPVKRKFHPVFQLRPRLKLSHNHNKLQVAPSTSSWQKKIDRWKDDSAHIQWALAMSRFISNGKQIVTSLCAASSQCLWQICVLTACSVLTIHIINKRPDNSVQAKGVDKITGTPIQTVGLTLWSFSEWRLWHYSTGLNFQNTCFAAVASILRIQLLLAGS